MKNRQVSGIRCYRLGPFLLDAHRSRLWRDDEIVPLAPKAVEVLATLVEEHGRVVTKDELLARVWPSTVVEENNLARQISTLRKALHDSRDRRDFIVTVPGQGYRFVADVERVERDAPTADAGRTASDIVGPQHDTKDDEAAGRAGPAAAVHQTRRRPSSRPWLAGASAGAALGLCLVIAVALLSSVQAPRASSPDVPGALHRFTYGTGLSHHPTWSPDGTRIAFASDASGNSDIWEQSVANPVPVRLTRSAEQEWQPAWSPDGRSIAFRSERDGGGLHIMPAGGGPDRRVASFGYRPRWSPSGRWILLASSILQAPAPVPWIVDVGGDGRARPVRPDLVRTLRGVQAAWRPDRDELAFWGRASDGRWRFVTASIDESTMPREWSIPGAVLDAIGQAQIGLGAFAWAPDGGHLYFEGRAQDAANLWRVAVDPETASWTGAPERLTIGAGADGAFAVAPDGRRLAFSVRARRTRVWSFPFDPAEGRLLGAGVPLTSGGAIERDAAAPRDGLHVAFRSVRGGLQELRSRSTADGTERVLVSSHEWSGTGPRWSPDGRRLVYARRSAAGPGGPTSIAVLAADTGIERLYSVAPPMRIVPDDWSADGSTLVAACRPSPGQPHGICLVSLDAAAGSHAARVHLIASDPDKNLLCMRFSPDQRWIAFMAVDRRQPTRSTVYVMPSQGGPWTPVTDDGPEDRSYDDKPRWSPDGGAIYFVTDREGAPNVWGRRFDAAAGRPTGEPFRVTAFDDPSRSLATNLGQAEIAVSVDRLFAPVTETTGGIWMLDLVSR